MLNINDLDEGVQEATTPCKDPVRSQSLTREGKIAPKTKSKPDDPSLDASRSVAWMESYERFVSEEAEEHRQSSLLMTGF
ncbi:hypothetical protein Trydic_g15561 [Trypoxylus dichotomus]